ncbi:hypothetical protein BC827DRAFT_1194705 [Russula dissimulans]|nr:hypothetical protein BC827DRAFT_1194705 [Russula dissimulans]
MLPIKMGLTPLHMAARSKGEDECIGYRVLEHGARADATSESVNGTTPLHPVAKSRLGHDHGVAGVDLTGRLARTSLRCDASGRCSGRIPA